MRIQGSLPEIVRKTVERDGGRYCENRVPAHVRDKIRMEFEIRGNSVTIIERRPPWREDFGPEWSRLTVAQLRYENEGWALIGVIATASGTFTTFSSPRLISLQRWPRSTTTRRPFSGGDSLIRQLLFLPRATISSSADFRSRFLVSRILIMSTRRSRSPA